MDLVIVESPTKARKLAGYLGKEFAVEASIGHIRDLPKGELGIDLDEDFEPKYVVSDDKKDVVAKLKKLALKAEHIFLATDPDREGEAIAWHLQYLLSKENGKAGITASRFARASFHEVTKSAVLAAMEKPGKISLQLVDAQQARRVVDRLVGYKLSPVLWKKIRRGLSAGRVQSVALRMIVEREREIEAFKPEEYWELDVGLGTLDSGKIKKLFSDGKAISPVPQGGLVARVIEVNAKKYEPKKQTDVDHIVAGLEATGTEYAITDVEKKERKRSSLPPFTTSTLQQQAATRLGYTSKQTMRLAQQLYEEGLITYHRTDSVALSAQAIAMARDYISKQFGATYVPDQPRYFANSSKNAQEAHEAIRVTNINLHGDEVRSQGSFTERHVKLYDLIWRRFVASQMNTAVYDQTTVTIEAAPDKQRATSTFTKALLRTTGSVLKFDGWMKLFPASDDVILPDVAPEQRLNFVELNAAQKFTQPPPRYNDASLVKELEKRGIGRPSTYASIISVLEERGYVERLDKRFVATAVGMTVSDFLLKHFETIMDYDFTAEMEEDLDRIARGEKEWRKVVKTFFQPLSKTIDSVTKTADREQIPVEKTGDQCPTCLEKNKQGELAKGEIGEVVIRVGRFGKFKSCSRFPDCDYTENMVEKLEGQHCPLCREGDVIMRKTRWGKDFFGCSRYPDCDWASWKKPEPGLTITSQEWEQQKAARAERQQKRAATMEARGKGKTRRSSAKKSSTKKSSTKRPAKRKK